MRPGVTCFYTCPGKTFTQYLKVRNKYAHFVGEENEAWWDLTTWIVYERGNKSQQPDPQSQALDHQTVAPEIDNNKRCLNSY